MEPGYGPWLADLIESNLDSLARTAVTTARTQVPWYRSLPPDQLLLLFAQAYRALAAVFRSGEITPLRSYIEQVIPQRLHAGAAAEDLIHVAGLLEEGVQQLIARERAGHPANAAAAERHLSFVVKSMRLLISGINLRLLSKLPNLPPPGA